MERLKVWQKNYDSAGPMRKSFITSIVAPTHDEPTEREFWLTVAFEVACVMASFLLRGMMR